MQNNQPSSSAEYAEFQQWRTERIRSEERAKAQAEAAQVNLETEAAAERAALALLSDKYDVHDVKECFGATATPKGANAIKLIFTNEQGIYNKGTYKTLRALAVKAGAAK